MDADQSASNRIAVELDRALVERLERRYAEQGGTGTYCHRKLVETAITEVLAERARGESARSIWVAAYANAYREFYREAKRYAAGRFDSPGPVAELEAEARERAIQWADDVARVYLA